MVNSTPSFDSYPYDPLPHSTCIRLLRIESRKPDEDKTSSIRCRMKTVDLHSNALLKGESPEPPPRPTVRWDEYVTQKPKEQFKILNERRITTKIQRLYDWIRGRHSTYRRSQITGTFPEIDIQYDDKERFASTLRHQNLGADGNFILEDEAESADFLAGIRRIPPKLALDATEPPRGEPQYRERFGWKRSDNGDRLPGNYVAMSYTWGDPKDRVPIVIDEHNVHVTRNLEAGLREFRELEPFKRGLWIWIDAICINQDDEPERNAQVQIMSVIYERAGNIIVWLGPTDSTSDEAIKYLQEVGVPYRTEYVEAMDQADPITAHTHRIHAQHVMESERNGWSFAIRTNIQGHNIEDAVDEMVQVYQFFNRPYWRRLWIIQELAMGRGGMPIVCGSTVTQWRYIRDAVFMMSSALDVFNELIPRALHKRNIPRDAEHSLLHVAAIAQLECHGHRKPLPPLPEETQHWTLVDKHKDTRQGPLRGNAVQTALRLIRNAHTTKPIDRVYGVLAIPGLPRFEIEVSYQKSAGEVFVNFIKQCILKGYSAAVFQCLDGWGPSPSADYKLPFWCPDLDGEPGRQIGIIQGNHHQASGEPHYWDNKRLWPRFMTICGDEYLSGYGFVADTIDGLGAISMTDRAYMYFPPDFKPDVIPPTSQAEWPNRDKPKDALWWTLVGGACVGGDSPGYLFCELLYAIPTEEPPKHSPNYRLWDFIHTSRDFVFAGRPLKSYMPPGDLLDAAVDFSSAPARQAMAAQTTGRRLATTAKGSLALVPASSQSGDVVIVLMGHGNPVVATRLEFEHENIVYKIKGDALVYGIMEGQAVETEFFEGNRDYLSQFRFI
ncbi:hypothetical protein QQX98_010459 [Neonectria punicea]|uniref:Heterokaryon incompatibility domain-containing protein n=1 Tax=Neonectria punicea TaxID=979145 RepID=A0ABR1GPE3_9HYPO